MCGLASLPTAPILPFALHLPAARKRRWLTHSATHQHGSGFLFPELCCANRSSLLTVNKLTGTDRPSCPAMKTPDADICARARVSRDANHHRRTPGMQTNTRWKTRRLCLFSHSRGWKYAFARPKIRTRTYKHVITTCC